MPIKATVAATAEKGKNQLSEYVEDSLTEFWRKQGVTPIPVTPCKEGEEGFSWSAFINGLGRRTQ